MSLLAHTLCRSLLRELLEATADGSPLITAASRVPERADSLLCGQGVPRNIPAAAARLWGALQALQQLEWDVRLVTLPVGEGQAYAEEQVLW